MKCISRIWELYSGAKKLGELALFGVLCILVIFFVFVLLCMCVEEECIAYWFCMCIKKESIAYLFGTGDKNDILEFLGVGMGGILLALQVMASHTRARAMEDRVLKIEQGQRQEQLKNAIEHLGHASVSVRLGGAYELFHLAQDTEELRKTVLDILCSHIRQTTGEKEYQEKYRSNPSEEIQSLLTLLFVQDHQVFIGLRADLQGSWLNGAVLHRAYLEKALLAKTHLQKANLVMAQLQDAILKEANLQGAELGFVQLEGAFLRSACLQKADLHKANLRMANLREARLQGAKLWQANMQRVDFSQAYLHGANLSGGLLQGACFVKAYLQGSVCCVAHMDGANLREVNLQGADLGGVYLRGANLRHAQLQGSNLYQAKMQAVDVYHAELSGANSHHQSSSFGENMRSSIGQNSDLSGVVFAGGLSQDDVKTSVEGLLDDSAETLRYKLAPHIGQPETNQLPESSQAVTGAYTEEEAEEWIAEYEQAMSEW